MAERQTFPTAFWAENLEALDEEIARQATLCQVPLLERGVMERVLRKDASVCGTHNAKAFAKLQNLLMVHFAIRKKTVADMGSSKTAALENYVIDRLRKRFPDVGEWPSA